MKNKYRLISLLSCLTILTIAVTGAMLSFSASAKTSLVKGVTSAAVGSYYQDTVKFEKEYDTTGNLMTTFGDYIKVNGVLASVAYPHNGGAGNSVYFESASSTELKINSDNCSWVRQFEGQDAQAPKALGTASWQDAEIEILAGFPFKDGTTLSQTITLSRATNATEWVVNDPDPAFEPTSAPTEPTTSSTEPTTPPTTPSTEPTTPPTTPSTSAPASEVVSYPSTVLTDVTVSMVTKTDLRPEEAAKHEGWYTATQLTFNKALPSQDASEILRLYGDKLIVNGTPLAKGHDYINEGGGGTPAICFSVSDDMKTLTVFTDVWSWTGNIMNNTNPNTVGIRAGQDNKVVIKEGFQFADGVLNKDINMILPTNADKWAVDDPNAEPDLDGVKVGVCVTDGEGGPGITDAVAGQSWQSVTKIVFDQPLTAEDASEEAVVNKFGPYITLNSKTVAELYKTNNKDTGVPHAVTMTLSADRKALTVYCDVSMQGVLVPSKDQFILISKDMPITSKATLGRDVAFEYTVESGDWTATDPYTDEDDNSSKDNGNADSSTADDTNPTSAADKGSDSPATGVPFAAAGMMIVAIAAGAVVLTTKKMKK